MAAMVLTAAYFSVTGPGTIHDHCTKIEIATEVEEKDVTTFASLGWRELLGGIKSGTVSGTLLSDYADDGLDEDLWAIFGTVVAWAARATQSGISASNPEWQASALIKNLVPLAGAPGDVPEIGFNWPISGAVTRDVTA